MPGKRWRHDRQHEEPDRGRAAAGIAQTPTLARPWDVQMFQHLCQHNLGDTGPKGGVKPQFLLAESHVVLGGITVTNSPGLCPHPAHQVCSHLGAVPTNLPPYQTAPNTSCPFPESPGHRGRAPACVEKPLGCTSYFGSAGAGEQHVQFSHIHNRGWNRWRRFGRKLM